MIMMCVSGYKMIGSITRVFLLITMLWSSSVAFGLSKEEEEAQRASIQSADAVDSAILSHFNNLLDTNGVSRADILGVIFSKENDVWTAHLKTGTGEVSWNLIKDASGVVKSETSASSLRFSDISHLGRDKILIARDIPFIITLKEAGYNNKESIKDARMFYSLHVSLEKAPTLDKTYSNVNRALDTISAQLEGLQSSGLLDPTLLPSVQKLKTEIVSKSPSDPISSEIQSDFTNLLSNIDRFIKFPPKASTAASTTTTATGSSTGSTLTTSGGGTVGIDSYAASGRSTGRSTFADKPLPDTGTSPNPFYDSTASTPNFTTDKVSDHDTKSARDAAKAERVSRKERADAEFYSKVHGSSSGTSATSTATYSSSEPIVGAGSTAASTTTTATGSSTGSTLTTSGGGTVGIDSYAASGRSTGRSTFADKPLPDTGTSPNPFYDSTASTPNFTTDKVSDHDTKSARDAAKAERVSRKERADAEFYSKVHGSSSGTSATSTATYSSSEPIVGAGSDAVPNTITTSGGRSLSVSSATNSFGFRPESSTTTRSSTIGTPAPESVDQKIHRSWRDSLFSKKAETASKVTAPSTSSVRTTIRREASKVSNLSTGNGLSISTSGSSIVSDAPVSVESPAVINSSSVSPVSTSSSSVSVPKASVRISKFSEHLISDANKALLE